MASLRNSIWDKSYNVGRAVYRLRLPGIKNGTRQDRDCPCRSSPVRTVHDYRGQHLCETRRRLWAWFLKAELNNPSKIVLNKYWQNCERNKTFISQALSDGRKQKKVCVKQIFQVCVKQIKCHKSTKQERNFVTVSLCETNFTGLPSLCETDRLSFMTSSEFLPGMQNLSKITESESFTTNYRTD